MKRKSLQDYPLPVGQFQSVRNLFLGLLFGPFALGNLANLYSLESFAGAKTRNALSISAKHANPNQHVSHYEGYLKGFGHPSPPKWIAADLTGDHSTGSLLITEPKTGNTQELPVGTIHFSHRFARGLILHLPDVGDFELPRKSDGCYHSSRGAPYSARACIRKGEDLEISIQSSQHLLDLELSVSPFSVPNFPPGPLDLKTAVRTALTTNPESQGEFEKRMQLYHSTASTWLRAFTPQGNFSTISSVAYSPTSPFTYVGALGNLTPFLSTGHWLDAFESRILRDIGDYTWRIYRGNLASQIESLIYAYRRDLSLFEEFKKVLLLANALDTRAAEIEKLTRNDGSHFLEGTAHMMDFIKTSLESLVSDTEVAVINDRSALCQAMGIHDSERVRDIKIGEEANPIRSSETTFAIPLKSDPIAGLAEFKSLERKQARLALQEGRIQEIGLFLRLLDPVGDPSKGLGIHTIWDGRAARGRERELSFYLSSVGRKVELRARNIVQQYNDSIAGYIITLKNLSDATVILGAEANLILEFDPQTAKGTITPSFDIQAAFSMYVASFAQLNSYHYNFRVYRSILYRITHQGAYHALEDTNSTAPLDDSSFDLSRAELPELQTQSRATPEDDSTQDLSRVD